MTYEGAPRRTLEQGQRVKDIPLDNLVPDAQTRLQEIDRNDEDVLWELRLGHEKWRVWGVFRGHVFYFIWWDREHSASGRADKGAYRR